MATSPTTKGPSLSKILVPIAVLLMLIISGLAAIKLTLNTSLNSNPAALNLETGMEAPLPDVSLTQLDGKTVKLSELKAKVFLVNFWATWCDACMEEMDSLVKLRENYKDKGFEILGVNLDENPASMVPKVSKQYGIEFPVFVDPEGKLAELFNVRAIPLSVVINSERKILLVKDGEQDWFAPEMRSELEHWLNP